MAVILAFLYRILFGRVGPEFDFVVAAYRVEDTLKTIRFIDLLRINLSIRNIYIVANHKDVISVINKKEKTFILEGSNNDAEWSAYQQGLTVSSSKGIAPGGLIIMNDTVTSHRSFTIIRYMKFISYLKNKQNSLEMAGFCDGAKNSGFKMFGESIGPWVSSYLFYITPDLVSALNMNVILRRDAVEEWFNTCSIDLFFPNWLNGPLISHLENWLFTGGWYGSQKLSSSNFTAFRYKLRSIFYEKNLSLEAQKIGFINDIMPKGTILRYMNDKIENFQKRRMPALMRKTISSVFLTE